MLVGVEVIPGTIEESIAKLRELGSAVDVVKVRKPDDLRAILDAGLSYRWLIRPPSEGRNPDEIVRDYDDWMRCLAETHQDAATLAYLLANEPNHPDSAYRGPAGAEAYLRGVLRPALDRIGDDALVPLAAPPLVPYYGTPEWTAAFDTLPRLLPAGHCYQNGGDSAGAVAECLAMAGGKGVHLLIADEVGDTNAGAEPSSRADRIAEQFYGLAQAGAMAAILFPLAGYADASISYDVDTIGMILSAGRAGTVARPKRTRKPKPVPEVPTMADKMRDKRLAVIWQFSDLAEQTVPEIAATLRQHGIDAVAFKTHDGVGWMGDVYSHPLAPRSATDVATVVEAFEAEGIACGVWVNVRGSQWAAQAELHALAAVPAKWIGLDLEPYDGFLGAYPSEQGIDLYLSTLIGDVSTTLGDDWGLAAWPDPRANAMEALRWERWKSSMTCVYPQVYWTDFQRPCRAVLDEALATCAHPDVRGMLPYDGWAQFPEALAHPVCANGAALWRMGSAGAASLAAFGKGVAVDASPAAPGPDALAHLDAVWGVLESLKVSRVSASRRRELAAYGQDELIKVKQLTGIGT